MTRTTEDEHAPEDVQVALVDPIRREILAVLAARSATKPTCNH
jgi:hypothetical protein